MNKYDYYPIKVETEFFPQRLEKKYKYFKKDIEQLKDAFMWARRKARFYRNRTDPYKNIFAEGNKLWAELFEEKAKRYGEEIQERARNRGKKTIGEIRLQTIKKWLYDFHHRPVKYKKLMNKYDTSMFNRYYFMYKNSLIRWDPILNYKLK